MKAVRLMGLATKEMKEAERQRQLEWERQQEFERKHAPLEITREGALRELPVSKDSAGTEPDAVRFPFTDPAVVLTELVPPQIKLPDEVLIRVLCVGLDETDQELMTVKSGIPPQGESGLTLGHALLGVIEEAGQDSGLSRGDLVTTLVRRACKDASCVNCRNGHADYCESGAYTERGIRGLNGCLSEYYVEQAKYVVSVPSSCLAYGVLAEPQSMVEKVWEQTQRIQQRLIWQPKTAVVIGNGPLALLAAMTSRCFGLDTVVWSHTPAGRLETELFLACGAEYCGAVTHGATPEAVEADSLVGFLEGTVRRADLIFECTGLSTFAVDAMKALAPGGVLALLGGTAGNRGLKLDSAMLKEQILLPLENKCIVGPGGASSRKNFETGLYRLELMEELFPGVLERLLSNRLPLEQVPSLEWSQITIKAVVDLVPPSQWEGLLGPDSDSAEYSFSV